MDICFQDEVKHETRDKDNNSKIFRANQIGFKKNMKKKKNEAICMKVPWLRYATI